ncbi:serglycin [Dunckerocampus dactyliophorus]|uniref:serglycin n=1 Tax=Dunckerocampus dactyliophorus TaxID=161453 RepID=UPI0024061111|nr:serglycin [Dunckerocampus dactyliophorus]
MTATLFFVACGLFVLQNVQGVPRTAAYKFVKCRPDGDRANCVAHQSPEMEWTPELPTKLPASSAQYLDSQPVDEDEDTVRLREATDDGSGYEGSAGQFLMDTFDVNTEREMGSGEPWTPRDTEQYKVGREYSEAFRRFLGGFQLDQEKPAEKDLEEDHLLQL